MIGSSYRAAVIAATLAAGVFAPLTGGADASCIVNSGSETYTVSSAVSVTLPDMFVAWHADSGTASLGQRFFSTEPHRGMVLIVR